MKKSAISIIFFLLIIVTSIHSQTTSVEFIVDMNYQIESGNFFPEYETVDIAGSFNGWGNNLNIMDDSDHDGKYSTSVILTIGETIEFKCRINGAWNGREEFPDGGPNRSYTVEENGVVVFWYNDEIPSTILDVRINSSAFFANVNEPIYFFDQSSGSPTQWFWEFPGGEPEASNEQNPIVSYGADGSYSITLTITNEENESLTKTFENFIRVGQQETFWWNDAVFYEVFVRSFFDTNADGKGDIQGLIEKLDYLNDGDPETNTDLGITGIWLMPIQQSPSYHGYDVVDYYTVEQDYGSNNDFKQLIEEAHSRGIKVIIDLVINHTSSQNPWFIESSNPTSDQRSWYIWSDTNPGFNGPWGQNVWHYRNGSYYYGLFSSGMPDLNYNTPDVKAEIFDIAQYWLEEMNVDGFRLDAVKYLFEDGTTLENLPATIEFWKDFRSFYKGVNPDAFSVGEAWAATEVVVPYVNDNALDYCFEFELSSALLYAVKNGNGTGLANTLQQVMQSYPYLQFGSFLTNHDMNRVMSDLGEDEAKAKIAASLLLTLPGIPYIYYGEEIGMIGTKPDEYIRTPMQWTVNSHAGFTQGNPWISVNSDYIYKNVEYQQSQSNSLWSLYRDLIEIRNTNSALRRGNYKPIQVLNGSVFAFLRELDGDNILVVNNLGDQTVSELSLQVPFSGVASGEYSLVDILGGSAFSQSVNGSAITNVMLSNIAPLSTRIYKLQSPGTDVDQKSFKGFTINLFPLPTTGVVNAQIFSNTYGKIDYSIIDATGRTVLKSHVIQSSSNQVHSINVSTLPKGFFIISFSLNGVKYSKPLVVK